jgi:hypothetical protein
METTEYIKATRGLLMIIIILGFIFGLAIIAFGAYMTYLGTTGNTEFTFFGQAFKSTNVGIASIFIGAALIVLVSGRVLKTVDKTVIADKVESTINSQITSSKKDGAKSASMRIVLHLSEELRRLNLGFGVLHVRDGKDEVSDSGPLLNKEISFHEIDRHGNIEATITFSSQIGFQFKCFVDHKPYEYDNIKSLLEKNDFQHISIGKGKPFRIWFILPEYDTYTTIDGILNNFYYPS